MGNKGTKQSEWIFYLMGKTPDNEWETQHLTYNNEFKISRYPDDQDRCNGISKLESMTPVFESFAQYITNPKSRKIGEHIYKALTTQLEIKVRIEKKNLAVVTFSYVCVDGSPRTVQFVLARDAALVSAKPAVEIQEWVNCEQLLHLLKYSYRHKTTRETFQKIVWESCKAATRETNIKDIIKEIETKWITAGFETCDPITNLIRKRLATNGHGEPISVMINKIAQQNTGKGDAAATLSECQNSDQTAQMELLRSKWFETLMNTIWMTIRTIENNPNKWKDLLEAFTEISIEIQKYARSFGEIGVSRMEEVVSYNPLPETYDPVSGYNWKGETEDGDFNPHFYQSQQPLERKTQLVPFDWKKNLPARCLFPHITEENMLPLMASIHVFVYLYNIDLFDRQNENNKLVAWQLFKPDGQPTITVPIPPLGSQFEAEPLRKKVKQ